MARHPRLGPLLASIALAAAAVACGDDGSGTATPPSDGATRPPADQPSGEADGQPGEEGPAPTGPDPVEDVDLGPFDFVAEGVQGGQVVGAELAGSDVVVWFWAPW
jgi:hypothetical protein